MLGLVFGISCSGGVFSTTGSVATSSLIWVLFKLYIKEYKLLLNLTIKELNESAFYYLEKRRINSGSNFNGHYCLF